MNILRMMVGGMIEQESFERLAAHVQTTGTISLEDLNRLLVDRELWAERLENVDGQICISCGCTQNNACDGGCSWATEDVCSSCAELAEARGTLVDDPTPAPINPTIRVSSCTNPKPEQA